MVRKRKEIPAVVVAVGERIDLWRQTRAKRTRMPEELWQAAAEVAAEHGIWFVSRVLRVNYDSLRQRIKREGEKPADGNAGFVELEAGALLGSRRATEAVLELSRPDGASVKMHVVGDFGFDLLALARVLWRNEA